MEGDGRNVQVHRAAQARPPGLNNISTHPHPRVVLWPLQASRSTGIFVPAGEVAESRDPAVGLPIKLLLLLRLQTPGPTDLSRQPAPRLDGKTWPKNGTRVKVVVYHKTVKTVFQGRGMMHAEQIIYMLFKMFAVMELGRCPS
ncbi:hypothetical protein Taro_026842, partial [Colocasia esculenta]|nr:hypothetical protein [Colocasia esculenta]